MPCIEAISDSFCSRLLYLVETGIVKYMLSENLTNAVICPLNLGTKERQLRNSDLAMTYYLMFSGYGVAAVIFSTEVSAWPFYLFVLNNHSTMRKMWKVIAKMSTLRIELCIACMHREIDDFSLYMWFFLATNIKRVKLHNFNREPLGSHVISGYFQTLQSSIEPKSQ